MAGSVTVLMVLVIIFIIRSVKENSLVVSCPDTLVVEYGSTDDEADINETIKKNVLGKKDNKTAEKILGNCFAILMLMAAALTVIFFTFAPQLLTMFGASDKTLPYGVDYARIYILGSIFVLIVMGMNPFITTQGFAKISMMTTVIGAVINIILDPIFIFVFPVSYTHLTLPTN